MAVGRWRAGARAIRALSAVGSWEEGRGDSGRISAGRGRHRGQRGANDYRVDGREHGGPADPGRLALPLLRGEPGAPLRAGAGVRDASQRAGGGGGARRARRRLADTELLIRVERDLTTPGEEAKFGGGKVIRDGMGQSARATRADEVLDVVITNAGSVDHWGIVKADIGIRGGRVAGIGKAGNPDLMAGVTPGMIVGAGTEVIAGEGKIVTAGGAGTHLPLPFPPPRAQ